MCVAVYELLTALLALELALPEEEIPKHTRSTQYQSKVFKDVNCFMSSRRRHLDKAGTLLFHNSTMQGQKGNEGCCPFETTRIRDLAVTSFDNLSLALMLSSLLAVQRGLS